MKVLVVDDMFNMRRTVKNMLRYIGFDQVSEAGDGAKAIEFLRQHRVDLVISDWNMPNMHGLDLLRKVRQIDGLKDVPFVMITAEVSEANIVQAAESEVDGYMIKPFVAKSLEEKIKTIFKNRADPSPFEKLMKAGQILMDAGSFAKAAEEYDRALEISPNSARARHALGEAYLKGGDLARAEKTLAEAVRINPQFLKAYESLGELYTALGDQDKALAFLEKAGRISPYNPERQVKLGKLYMEKGDKDKADQSFQLALKNAAHDPGLHTEIGEVYLAAGDDSKAAAAFSSSIDIIENVHVYNRLGIALRKKGEFEEALKVYQRALKLEPENEGLLYNLGRLYYERGMSRDAVNILKRALAHDPEFDECKRLLNKIEKSIGLPLTP